MEPTSDAVPAQSEAAKRLMELKKKLLSGSRPSVTPVVSETASALPTPAPRSVPSSATDPIKRRESVVKPVGSANEVQTATRRESLFKPEGEARPVSRRESTLKPSASAADVQPVTRRESTASLDSAAGGKAKKAPLTLRALMGNRKKSIETVASTEATKPAEPVVGVAMPGSRLKAAPAHRLLAESKTSLIRSKMISLNSKQSELGDEPPAESNSVADVIAKFEQNPPAALLGNPLAALGNPPAALFNPAAALGNPPGKSPRSAHPFASLLTPAVVTPSGGPSAAEAPLTIPESPEAFVQRQKVWLKRKLRETGIDLAAAKRNCHSPNIDNVAQFVQEHRQFLASLTSTVASLTRS